MPQMTDITLADAQGTPVNHVFEPNGPDKNGVFWLTDRSAENSIGFWQISIGMKIPPPPSAKTVSEQRAYKITIQLHEPVLEVPGDSTLTGFAPAPTVAYIPRAFVEFAMPERSSALDKQNLRKMIANLLDNSQIIEVVEDLSRPY